MKSVHFQIDEAFRVISLTVFLSILLILPVRNNLFSLALAVLSVGLAGCGQSESRDLNQARANEKTNISTGDISISVKPTTEISSEEQNIKSKNGTQSVNNIKLTPLGDEQVTGNLTEKGGAYFLDDSPFNGEFLDHHDNGNKSVEGKFLNGKQVGVWTYFHEDGSRFRAGEYVNGHADGQWIIWRKDGSKWSEKKYVNGQLNGVETRWHSNGKKQSETEWDGGKVLSKKEWDESGKLKS